MKLRSVISRVRCPQHGNNRQHQARTSECVECDQFKGLKEDYEQNLQVHCLFDLTKGVNKIVVAEGAPHTVLVTRKVHMQVYCPLCYNAVSIFRCRDCFHYHGEETTIKGLKVQCVFKRQQE